MAKLWKYVELKSLSEAGPDEKVCTSYYSPSRNVSGKKTEEKMLAAEKDAQAGECRLLVWREVEVDDSSIRPIPETNKPSKSLELLLDRVEDLGWKYTIYPNSAGGSDVELENHSDAEEDLIYTVHLKKGAEASSFIKGLRDICDAFDIEKHVEESVLAKERGKRTDISIYRLVKDAEAIFDMLETLWYEVKLIFDDHLVSEKEGAI